MTSLAPGGFNVRAVTLTPPTISLLNAAVVMDENNERWVNGLTYASEGCDAGEIFVLCDNDPTTGFEKSISAAGAPVTGTPYGIVAQDTCSTFSRNTRDYEGRATRKLLAMESYLIAEELWGGSLNLNPKLASSSAVIAGGTGGAPESLLTAIGAIEEAFYAHSPANRAMIHMRPLVLETLMALTGGGALRREGNVYYTNMDSVVAVDRGYLGTGPSGQSPTAGNEWIYATPLVHVRHSPVMVIPNNVSEAVLRTENQVTYFAERAVHAGWDYTCATIALNVKRNG